LPRSVATPAKRGKPQRYPVNPKSKIINPK
jgi:hypothetical protein